MSTLTIDHAIDADDIGFALAGRDAGEVADFAAQLVGCLDLENETLADAFCRAVEDAWCKAQRARGEAA